MKQLIFLCCTSALWALPQAPLIQSGDVQFNCTDGMMEIQTSDRAIIDWKDFSIELGEHVRIHQPSTNSSLLNRVIEAYPSRLLGGLEANGQVLLINPNGILVGKEAHIDTGSFIASTLDVQNRIFLENCALVFEGTSLEGIVNEGIIHTSEGELYLIGHTVINKGSAEADTAALIAGTKVILKPAGFEHIYVRGSSFSEAFIHPDEPEWDLVTQAINEGEIRASNVYVCGEQVGLRDGSKIDASGNLGGNVYIGGDYQGENKVIENASYVWVEPGAKIDASCNQLGDGGQVIVWSENGTYFYGNVITEGGVHGGNGGFVEVSGGYLDFQGKVSTVASNGKTGTLLLDPFDITISAAGDTPAFFTPFGLASYISSGGACGVSAGAILTPATLIGALAATSVIVQTGPAGCIGGPCPGDIFVISPVSYSSVNDLTLDACGTINVTSPIQNTLAAGGGDVTLIAQTAINIGSSPIAVVTVSVGTLSGSTIVNAPNADLTMTAASLLNSGAQLGFHVPNPDPVPFPTTITGPIQVLCNNLVMQGDTVFVAQSSNVAWIGHGSLDFYDTPMPFNGNAFSTSANATIDVTARGNISMISGSGENAAAFIGHGSTALGAPSNLLGDITIRCGGDLLMEVVPFGGFVAAAQIGHGTIRATFSFAPLAGVININGNIFVDVQGDILMLENPVFGFVHDIVIGHVTSNDANPAAAHILNVTGDIDVYSGRDIRMTGNATAFERLNIGHLTANTVAPPQTAIGDIRVRACQDIIMEGNGAQYCVIGENEAWTNITQTCTVVAGRDLRMIDTFGGPFTGGARIGAITPTFSPGVKTTSTYVAVGRDILMSGFNTNAIVAYGDVIVSAGGNINVLPIGGSSHYIGTELLNGGFRTQIFAGGNIIGQNSPSFAVTFFGTGPGSGGFPIDNSLDIRAGGDINIPFGFFTQDGFIFLEADTELGAGALWTSSGGAINSIGGFSPPFPVNTSLCLGASVNANSAPIFSNCNGGLLFDAGVFAPFFVPFLTTTTGNITLHSSPTSTQTTSAVNLSLGSAPGINNVSLFTIDGDIEIYGTNTGNFCSR